MKEEKKEKKFEEMIKKKTWQNRWKKQINRSKKTWENNGTRRKLNKEVEIKKKRM